MQDQSQWNIYQENHEIEQIWYSSRKISDKMQVRDRQWSWIYVEWQWSSRYGKNDDPHSTPVQITTLTMDTYWITDYREYGWEIRIPFWWSYTISWVASWWVSSATNRVWIECNWKIIFQIDLSDNVNDVQVYEMVNLWKYDKLTFWTQTISYSWSSTWITTQWRFKLYITKL